MTGGALRIGREIALYLAARGWSVGVHYHRSASQAEDVVARIMEAGGRAAAFGADLAEAEGAGQLMSRAAEVLGPVTCLVNNASTFERDNLETMTPQSWESHMAINLRAPLLLSQSFGAALGGDHDGVVINMLDQRVWKLTPEFLSYTVSKSALWTLTRTLAQALAPRIRVNAIGPGPTLPSKRQSARHFAAQIEALPLKRATTTEDICQAIGFILSAPSLTGQMIALDGGQHLAWRTPDIIDVEE